MPRYAHAPPEEADVVVALGGDGLMLQSLHRFMGTGKPIYGMNKGSVGFLMNDFREDGLLERLEAAQRSIVHPLLMVARDLHGVAHTARAINEVSMLRQTYQAAKLRVSIDGKVRLEELIADGAPDRDAGRLDRLQPLGQRPDPAAQRAPPRADADLRLPARGAGAARCCPTTRRSRST